MPDILASTLTHLNGRARVFRFTSLTLIDEHVTIELDRETYTITRDRSRTPDQDLLVIEANGHSAPGYAGVPVIDATNTVIATLAHHDEAPVVLDASELLHMRGAAAQLARWSTLRAAVRGDREERPDSPFEPGTLLALDAAMSRALVAPGLLRDNLSRALEQLVQALGVRFARVWTGTPLAVLATAGRGGSDDLHLAVKLAQIAETRTPQVTNAVADDPSIDQLWARREGMVAFAGYPLIADGELVGVFALFAQRPLSPAALVVMETLGRTLSQAIARYRAQARLLEREQWLETTLGSIGDGVIAVDEHGRVNYLNAIAVDLTGWSFAEAYGRPLVEVFPIFNQTTGDVVESPVAKVLRDGRIAGLANHTVLRHRDGRLTPIEDSAAPIRLPGGTLTGVVLVFRDASELRAAEARQDDLFGQERLARVTAERERERSDFLVNTATTLADGLDVAATLQRLVDLIAPSRADIASVWMKGPDGIVTRVVHAPYNQPIVAADRTNEDQERAPIVVQDALDSGVTQVVSDLQKWVDSSATPPAYREVIKQLGIRSVVTVPIRRDRTVVAALSIASLDPHPIDRAEVAMYEGIARLTTLALDNSRLYAEAARLRAIAEQGTLAKDHFLAHVSHDLRNPLGTILGWSALLRGNPASTQLAKGLEVIERNAQAQVQLIEDLLDVSRIQTGKLTLDVSVQDVRDIIDTALDPARLAATAKNVTLTSEIDADVGAIVVDPERFRQVVWNLVSNAVKFTPAGGSVTVSAHRSESLLEISVADTGRGIDTNFLPRVFDSFEQAEHGAKRSGGLGIGLAIVRHVVEMHGGTVTATSDGVGKGATFVVRMPIRASVLPAHETPKEGVEPVHALAGVTILAVDDEQDARDVLVAILEQAGAKVTPAASALEAYEYLVRERPALVVSDINMPDHDGHYLIRRIRALSPTEGGRTPAVALTAMTRAQNRIEALTAGFNAHVAKPVEPAELVLTLVSLLRRN